MQMYDGAYPPAHPPAWPVVAGYLGGNTPHAWSAPDWAHQPARYRLPIWVRSNPGGVVVANDVSAAVAAAQKVGAPRGCTIALDFETAVNAAYVMAFERAMTTAGYVTMLYGSASTVVHNPKPNGGYWMAAWTGTPHFLTGSAATQYTNGAKHPEYDSSLISTTVKLWDTKPPAKPPTPPAPPSDAAARAAARARVAAAMSSLTIAVDQLAAA